MDSKLGNREFFRYSEWTEQEYSRVARQTVGTLEAKQPTQTELAEFIYRQKFAMSYEEFKRVPYSVYRRDWAIINTLEEYRKNHSNG